MSRLTRRVALKPRNGGGAGKTRAQFDAHVATLGSPVTWSDTMGSGESYFAYNGDVGSAAYGSTWRPGFDEGRYYGLFDKGAAHAFPDAATRLAQIGRRVFVRSVIATDYEVFLAGRSRNGVTTFSSDVGLSFKITEFIYFDDETGQAFTVNPSSVSPVFAPYAWTP